MPEKLSQGPRVGYDLAKTGAGLSRGPFKGKTLPAAPWSQTWPAPGATLDLDFANNRGFVRGVGQGGAMDAVTFTRASVGRFVNEQGLLDEAANNQPRFDWASTAQLPQNLLRYTEEFDNAYWTKLNLIAFGSGSVANTVATTDPIGTNTADFIVPSTTNDVAHGVFLNNSVVVVANTLYTYSVYAKAENYDALVIGAHNADNEGWGASFNLTTGLFVAKGASVIDATITSAGNGWYRCTATVRSDDASASVRIYGGSSAQLNASGHFNAFVGNGTSGIYIWGAQVEVGSTATTYLKVEGFSPSNTPLTANPTSNGLLIEESRTNRILWNRDATQANWVSTNITAAKDQTGIDGVANAASSLTATSADGTCIQTITLASGSRTGSVYLKRITGTGTIQVSLDGSTWPTVDLSDTEWRRIVLSGTVTNPTVGIKIATSGDAVAMDYAQVEDGAFATTPILTTTATVTRAAEATSMNLTNSISVLNYQSGTCLVNFKPVITPIGATENTIINVGGTNGYFNFYNQSGNRFGLRAAGTVNNTINGFIFPLVENKIAASWAKTGIKRSSNSGVFDQRFEPFFTFAPQAFERLAALNSTTKRVIYYPVELSISALQETTR